MNRARVPIKPILASLLVCAFGILGPTPLAAAASPTQPVARQSPTSVVPNDSTMTVYSPTAGRAVALTSTGTYTAQRSADGSTVTLTFPDGHSVTVNALQAPDLESSGNVHTSDMAARHSTFACSMAITVVGWIHSWGWTAAAALLATQGAAGAAIAAYVWAYGVDTFFVWVGTHC